MKEKTQQELILKVSWTKEEIIKLLSTFGKYIINKESHLDHMIDYYADEWAEENLN